MRRDTEASLPADLLRRFRDLLGETAVLAGEDIPARNLRDASELPGRRPLVLLRPKDADGVAAAVRLCAVHGLPATVQGGLTGLSGGAIPTEGSVALSLERISGIEALDAEAGTITVRAGTPLSVVQEAANAAGLLYPVDLNARGSCTIGGTIATNAGGNRVIRYGMTRQSVLGLEVVLADGRILSDLRDLPKNNAGFDLKQIFIGSEGQLGIVTRALLRLLPLPADGGGAILGFSSFDALHRCLASARAELGDALSAFEAMWPDYWDAVTSGGLADRRSPLSGRHLVYALIEARGRAGAAVPGLLQEWLERMLEADLIEDAALARSGADMAAFWALREAAAELHRVTGPLLGFDIGVSPPLIGAYVEASRVALAREVPHVRALFFGHAGDGNLHVMLAHRGGFDAELIHACDAVLYRLVGEFRGTVTAEHGVGLLKRDWLSVTRSPVEIAAMRMLKTAFDPKGLLNPGKVLPD